MIELILLIKPETWCFLCIKANNENASRS